MSKYIIRLDDACEYMDVERWSQMESLLDQYSIQPIVGIIPQCEDPALVQLYSLDADFWEKAQSWQNKGWTIAQHGYNHVYSTSEGGLNPVNQRSEFAGLPYDQQAEKIRKGYQILLGHQLDPRVFFAPSHTFDANTLNALIQETPIRIVSDTIARDQYYDKKMHFIPQQTGKARALPFKLVTFCYHPNEMTERDFAELEQFIIRRQHQFVSVHQLDLARRKRDFVDRFLTSSYFTLRSIRRFMQPKTQVISKSAPISCPFRVLHVFARLNRGGAETMVMNLYRQIDRSNYQFDFVVHTEEKGEYEDEIVQLGGHIYRLPRYSGLNHFAYLRAWRTLLTQHPEIKIIHGHVRSTAAFYLKIAKSRGLIALSHSHSISSGGGIAGKIKDIYQLRIRYTADGFLACSQNAGLWLFGQKACSSDRFHILNNAIETRNFIYSPARAKQVRQDLGIDNQFVLGHIGRFIELKNHSFIFKVFIQLRLSLPDSLLLLVGDGELLDEMKRMAKQLGLEKSVIFTGSRADIPDLLCAMDAFILPSKYEGLPVTLIEAQASGVPCFVSDVVSREVVLTDLIYYHNLSEQPETWAADIYRVSQLYQRHDQIESVSKAGYDVSENAQWLARYYQTELEKRGIVSHG